MDWIKLLDLTGGVAGIVGMIVIVKIFMKHTGNHMQDATKSQQRLADMIEHLVKFLERREK